MDRTKLISLTALSVIVLHSSFARLAGAEEPRQPRLARAGSTLQPRFALVLRYSDDPMLGIEGAPAIQRVDIAAPPVPRECKPRYMAGPAVGMVVGPAAGVGGLLLVASGSGLGFTGIEKTGRDRARQAGGALVMAAGFGVFLYSIGKLATNRRKRRRVCDEPQQRSWRGITSDPR